MNESLLEEKVKSSLPWYREGLRFQCTQCGKCCTGAPGYVWVSEEEIIEMAHYLKITVPDFKRLYLRRLHGRFLLVEKKSSNHDCVFFKNSKCTVYQARPLQCRTFPFWQENVHSEKSWQATSQQCEGIQENAPLFSYEEIQTMIDSQKNGEHFVSNPD